MPQTFTQRQLRTDQVKEELELRKKQAVLKVENRANVRGNARVKAALNTCMNVTLKLALCAPDRSTCMPKSALNLGGAAAQGEGG